MKPRYVTTYEVAEVLELLAEVLRALPNRPLGSFRKSRKRTRETARPTGPSAVATLRASLETRGKAALLALIADANLRVTVGPKDSAEKIAGRIVRLFEADPGALRRLLQQQERQRNAMPELSSALRTLRNFREHP